MKIILTVDHEGDILTGCHLGLTAAGYLAYEANSVESAYELARRHLPHLILCDVNMPNGGGRALLQQIRLDPDLALKPFVFMCGNASEMTPQHAMELGADDALAKPFSLDELWRCVEARLA